MGVALLYKKHDVCSLHISMILNTKTFIEFIDLQGSAEELTASFGLNCV